MISNAHCERAAMRPHFGRSGTFVDLPKIAGPHRANDEMAPVRSSKSIVVATVRTVQTAGMGRQSGINIGKDEALSTRSADATFK